MKKYVKKYSKVVQREFLIALIVIGLYNFLSSYVYFHIGIFGKAVLVEDFIVGLALVFLYTLHPNVGWFVLVLTLISNNIFWQIVSQWGIGGFTTRFHVIWESTPEERSDYVTGYLLQNKHFYWLFALLIGIGLLWYLEHRRVHKKPLLTTFKGRMITRSVFAALVLGVSFLFWGVLRVPVASPAVIVWESAYHAHHDVLTVQRRAKWLAEQTLPDLHCDTNLTKVVVIIGESANRDWMGVYRDLPTTPFLAHLPEKYAVLTLKAIGPGDITRLSLPLILTSATVHNPSAFEHSFSIVSLLRACGFQTFWLSNQELIGKYTMESYSIGGEADISRYTRTSEEAADYSQLPYDEDLLRLISPREIVPGKKQAFVFHLMGSHFRYRYRYPPDFGLYSPPRSIFEDYENTIYYTDFVISQIVSLFQPSIKRGEHVLFLYFSDHGEVVTESLHGHGLSTAFQEEHRSPFIIWTTDPQIVQKLYSALPCSRGVFNLQAMFNVTKYILSGVPDNLKVACDSTVIHLDHTVDYFAIPAATTSETREQEIVKNGNYLPSGK